MGFFLQTMYTHAVNLEYNIPNICANCQMFDLPIIPCAILFVVLYHRNLVWQSIHEFMFCWPFTNLFQHEFSKFITTSDSHKYFITRYSKTIRLIVTFHTLTLCLWCYIYYSNHFVCFEFFTQTLMRVHIHIHTHAEIHAQIKYTHTRMHTQTHTHKYTYMHTFRSHASVTVIDMLKKLVRVMYTLLI